MDVVYTSESGTPPYTGARLYGARAVLESNAKRADKHLVLEDLRRATKVIARAQSATRGHAGSPHAWSQVGGSAPE